MDNETMNEEQRKPSKKNWSQERPGTAGIIGPLNNEHLQHEGGRIQCKGGMETNAWLTKKTRVNDANDKGHRAVKNLHRRTRQGAAHARQLEPCGEHAEQG
jgi:hypothetical protein